MIKGEPIASLPDIQIIFFDLDDTLCAYWDACKIALRETFQLHGPEEHEVEDLVSHWAAAFRDFSPSLKKTDWYQEYLKRGEPTRTEQMRLTLERLGITNRELAEKLSQCYADSRNRNLHLFPDAKVLLDHLQGKIRMGLITNGPADIQRQEIATLGIGHLFEHVYIEGEVGYGKPLPELFTKISQDVQVEPANILFIGNSYAHDVRPALAAGWHAVWVRRESDVPPSAHGVTATPEEMPQNARLPDAIVEDLTLVLPMLTGLQTSTELGR